jgi:hypothetical protein
MRIIQLLAAGAATATLAVAAPAAAQTYNPYQPPQQTYPQYQYPQQGYGQPVPQPFPGQPGYGYQQPGYAQPHAGNPVEQIINQLLGNRYQVNDRTAVTQCATAAMTRAAAQYRQHHAQQGYGHPAYNQHYNQAANMRVTAITDVRRQGRSLQVSGLISSGMQAGYPPYGQAYGYQGRPPQHGYANQHHAAVSDLSFRCTVSQNGRVTNVRIARNTQAYRR